MFERSPQDSVLVRCGDVDITKAVMGHIGSHISLKVTRKPNPPTVTMAAFEAMDERAEQNS